MGSAFPAAWRVSRSFMGRTRTATSTPDRTFARRLNIRILHIRFRTYQNIKMPYINRCILHITSYTYHINIKYPNNNMQLIIAKLMELARTFSSEVAEEPPLTICSMVRYLYTIARRFAIANFVMRPSSGTPTPSPNPPAPPPTPPPPPVLLNSSPGVK